MNARVWQLEASDPTTEPIAKHLVNRLLLV
jgi:hypothetical protein